MYREYSRRTARDSHRNDNNGLAYFVSKPCGPNKLARALEFCLRNHNFSHSSIINPGPQLSSPGLPYEGPASSQSLIGMSSPQPEVDRAEHYLQGGNFPPTSPTRAGEFLAPAADDARPEKQRPLLLLVDDNNINLKLLSTFAKKNSYEYDAAENGLVALQAFQNAPKPHDIVFMDISMPVMDGIEATRAMRKLEHERQQKPAMIIALTGLGSASFQQEAFSNGINIFLTKPISFDNLRKILNDWAPDMEPQSHDREVESIAYGRVDR
ncbi:hypothetical protein AJ80_08208 [Polytolypa hystricis UAMH7299]|uniref:Response regulatory domain-containing protein n=1 Tax=Polytolypa hystricis (strain UAMH7299) TaxID=1447883 RepID=A0A2B7XBH2_POLH7|nr:hypothetical protein AJ80_08208 [Polytolypa hystricis UAMH7299]